MNGYFLMKTNLPQQCARLQKAARANLGTVFCRCCLVLMLSALKAMHERIHVHATVPVASEIHPARYPRTCDAGKAVCLGIPLPALRKIGKSGKSPLPGCELNAIGSYRLDDWKRMDEAGRMESLPPKL